MERVTVQSVSGRKILANGKWLTAVGNKNFHAGDLAWSDGRCVYGHSLEQGGNTYIPTQKSIGGIPIMLYNGSRWYFDKDKLNELPKAEYTAAMVNNSNQVRYFFAEDGVLDSELLNTGTLYTLHDGYYAWNFPQEQYETVGDFCVKLNGERFIEFDFMHEYLHDAIDTVKRQAAAAVDPIKSDFEIIYQGQNTYFTYSDLRIVSGRVDANGNYTAVFNVIADGESERYALIKISPDEEIGVHAYGYCNIIERYVVTNGSVIPWTTAVHAYDQYKTKYFASYAAPNDSIIYPIQDGYYFTFAGNIELIKFTERGWINDMWTGGEYVASICTPKGELIGAHEFNPFSNLLITKIGNNRYLLMSGEDTRYGLAAKQNLFILQDSVFTKFDNKLFYNNLRLRKLKNIKAWDKA